jgi:DNA-binding transcriptional ArsR family regulator
MIPDTSSLKPLADEATSLLKALAHPLRLTICCQLRDTEMSVGDIETQLGFKQPRLSRELAKLRDEGLVETRRESKVIFYRLADHPRGRAMIDAICAVMLNKAVPAAAPATAPKLRPNRPGGYGVFARTESRTQN